MDNRLKTEILPATILLNNFITNEQDSNYEIFLLEYLNKSSFFQCKSDYHKFVRPSSESNAECDAISLKYQIDFKLLATKTYLRGLRLTSPSVSVPIKGVTAYGALRKPKETFRVGEIHKIFRCLSLDKMIDIRKRASQITPYSDEDDILSVLKTIETKKNLLIFFPYSFSIDEEVGLPEIAEIISNSLHNDFHILSQYRKNTSPDLDTFLVTVYNDKFLLFSFEIASFSLLEMFDFKKSPTFVKLYNYSSPFK